MIRLAGIAKGVPTSGEGCFTAYTFQGQGSEFKWMFDFPPDRQYTRVLL